MAFGPKRALVLALLLSLGVETAQLWLPGRHASLGDLTSNTTGAAFGIALFGLRGKLWPSSRAAALLAIGWAAFALGVLLVGNALLEPTLPRTDWWGQWTPVLEGSEVYRGRVVSAHIGEVPIPSHRLERSDSVPSAFARGEPIRVVALAGPATRSPAPIFSIADAHPREILMIGASGEDLVFRIRRRSADYLLDRPDLRIHGGLADVKPGDTLHIAVTPLPGDGYRLELNGQRRDARVGFADTWSLLLWPETVARSDTLRVAMRVIWLTLLSAPALLWLIAGLRPRTPR